MAEDELVLPLTDERDLAEQFWLSFLAPISVLGFAAYSWNYHGAAQGIPILLLFAFYFLYNSFKHQKKIVRVIIVGSDLYLSDFWQKQQFVIPLDKIRELKVIPRNWGKGSVDRLRILFDDESIPQQITISHWGPFRQNNHQVLSDKLGWQVH